MVTQLVYNLSSLGTSQHVNKYKQFFRQIYKTTQVHQTITGKQNLQFHTKTYP